ncbi:gamma-mobile-trio recombinase GmtY (plasmid) [Photobacterium sp. DA100]|uniref:gamma-mobile-trio recombinase GmtY n=1 Tax=Photobacterium sp. DA100 TaxID=3027472 RepID=UPI00247B26E8|nr:gamma-mobile-trio recombinase GmtY [Photobacterium sp. DA100]WEM45477.1 gamma-mobile-trio recombinase GmtY [Photobacterium sp. DA100]
MVTVRAKAKVQEDNTGVKTETYILLTEQGDIPMLTDYILKLQGDGASKSTLARLLQATSKLMAYMDVNKDVFNDPELLFQTFATRLYTGTIGEDGLDPSGLYWMPASTHQVNLLVSSLTKLTDYLAKKHGAKSMNPLRDATPHEERLNYAAWYRRTQYDFLGHIEDKNLNETTKKVRTVKGRSRLKPSDNAAKRFPRQHFDDFFFAISKSKDVRVSLRNQMITTLMEAGGLRHSEAINLWVTDVLDDPEDPENCIVRIYDEQDGKAPFRFKSKGGQTNRASYLKEKYGRIPRKNMVGNEHVGQKWTKPCNGTDNFIQVYWFPSEAGRVFKKLWQQYIPYRANMVSVNKHHPYAFVSFSKDKRYYGSPIRIKAFESAYEIGLRRIGLEPNKDEGLAPHGHRHAYGYNLSDSGLSPFVIQKALHHANIESQLVYTEPSAVDVTKAMKVASKQLQQRHEPDELEVKKGIEFASNALIEDKKTHKIPDWQSLTEYGFQDIDPQGLFTGKHPKFSRKRGN